MEMNESKRAQTLRQIGATFAELTGYTRILDDFEIQCLEMAQGQTTFNVSITLSNKWPIYSSTEHVGLTHNALQQEAAKLLGLSSWEPHLQITSNYSKLASWDSKDLYAADQSTFQQWIEQLVNAQRIAETTLRPFSDPGHFAERCLQFYTKWPNIGDRIGSADFLIAYGLSVKRGDCLETGIERLRETLVRVENGTYHLWPTQTREHIQAVIDAAVRHM